VAALPAKSCVVDGEAIVCDDSGLAVFDLIRSHGAKATALHVAFDLLELDGQDSAPPSDRRAQAGLVRVLRGAHSTIVANAHFEGDGAIIYKHASVAPAKRKRTKNTAANTSSGVSGAPHRNKFLLTVKV
jgi:ATP-dependent DNA ligase